MFVDDLNRIMTGRLEADCSIGLHKHENSSEIIYILEGEETALFDG